MTDVDLLILGAGPAGMSAAIEARSRGLTVLLLDENPAPGGQVHRAVEARMPEGDIPGAREKERWPGELQDRDGTVLARQFRRSGAEYRPGTTLWAVEPGGKVYWSEGGVPQARCTTADRVLICAGATERPLPIPGWTLPGVMTVGAAQIALKTSGLVPEGKCWVAGQGPLLWLYAAQVVAKGGKLAGIVDLSPPLGVLLGLGKLWGALMAPEYLSQGLAWQRIVKKAGVPVLRAEWLRAEGEGRLQAIEVKGERHPADLLLLHDGLVPNTQITRAIPGCEHEWDDAQQSFRPKLDDWGNTTVAGILVAGDAGGIGGARAAGVSGRIAAIGVAFALGRLDETQRDRQVERLRLAQKRHQGPRAFVDSMYPPLSPTMIADDTVLCRCEEVTAGKLRESVGLGCLGANQAKAFTRAGMGPCQGRVCGSAVHGVIAAKRGVHPATVDPFRTRFPTKPLTLGELAALSDGAAVSEA